MSDPDLYHYTECGLDNVYLSGGVAFADTPRGRGVTIRDIEGLHRAIGLLLVREKKSLSGREFRFLRHELNVTQQSLADLLGVSVQRVARWEKGKTAIDRPAERLIRLLYREKVENNTAITEPLQRLSELDEILLDEDGEKLAFAETREGWQPAELAAA